MVTYNQFHESADHVLGPAKLESQFGANVRSVLSGRRDCDLQERSATILRAGLQTLQMMTLETTKCILGTYSYAVMAHKFRALGSILRT